jgi:hypothetical protein
MSFMFPRTITIQGRVTPARAGVQPLREANGSQTTPVATNVPCSIQYDQAGQAPLTGLPLDPEYRGTWKIFIGQRNAVAFGVPGPGSIRNGDVLTDDIGGGYKVSQAYWNSLGWNLKCEGLQK